MIDNASAKLVEMTAEIVSSYVGYNVLPVEEVPSLISQVFLALKNTDAMDRPKAVDGNIPAVPIKKSILPDYIICLEDGKRFKSLKRHLWTSYNMTPQEYRDKWCLAEDYPMVAPNYAAARSALAKRNGLGRGAR
jgi:predicted transcriptional regulator